MTTQDPYKAGLACARNYPEQPRPSIKLLSETWKTENEVHLWFKGYQQGMEEEAEHFAERAEQAEYRREQES